MNRIILALIITAAILSGCSGGNISPVSPDGQIKMTLGDIDNEAFSYAVYKSGQLMVRPSSIVIEFRDQPSFGGDLGMEFISGRTVDEEWEPLWGKTEKARNHYNEYVFRLSESGEEGRQLEWIIRMFDDGVAFRYRFPEGSGFGDFTITQEKTSFYLDPANRAWAANHEHYYSSQEHPYEERPIGGIGQTELIGCPLLVEVGQAGWLLISEADLTDWAGLYFRVEEAGTGRIVSSLASLKRDPAIKVEGSLPSESPWRVIMVGDNPGVFIESNMIANLNDPVEYADVDWIRPGRSAWDRWWSGDYGPDAGFDLGMNTSTMKYFVDLADEMDWEYMIVDWTWYGTVFTEKDGIQVPNPEADITQPVGDVDIHGIIKYASERNVDIILWVLSDHLDRQMDEAMALYEAWGVAGIKVDFMDCDDQDMVMWYHKVARKAAEHHLVVDFHGAYKPTGVSRTLPNLLTREGVLGNEYTKWSDLITPRHTVVLPFTRGLLGEMDFTPGGFNHVHQEDFMIAGGDAPNPYVMGTRCHQLAMLVIYESAFTVICDSPYNYKDQPGSDLLKLVPTTWSETKFLEGYPGEHIILARRSGQQWYLAGMTGEAPRETVLKLDFLQPGTFNATLWKDAGDSDEHPASLEKEEFISESGASIDIKMEKGGGFVIILDPA